MGEVLRIPESLPMFRRPPGLPATCSDEDLEEAVKASLCGADDKSLAKLLKVPSSAVKYWTDSKEWGGIVALLLPEVQSILKGQLTRLASTALTQLDERLQKGDPIYDLTGEYKGRKKLKARDLADIAVKVMEQQRALERSIGDISDDENRISLDKLAKALKKAGEEREIDVTPQRVTDDPRPD